MGCGLSAAARSGSGSGRGQVLHCTTDNQDMLLSGHPPQVHLSMEKGVVAMTPSRAGLSNRRGHEHKVGWCGCLVMFIT